jgi:hypothetical protein
MKIRRLNCVGMVWGNVLGMGIDTNNGLKENGKGSKKS